MKPAWDLSRRLLYASHPATAGWQQIKKKRANPHKITSELGRVGWRNRDRQDVFDVIVRNSSPLIVTHRLNLFSNPLIGILPLFLSLAIVLAAIGLLLTLLATTGWPVAKYLSRPTHPQTSLLRDLVVGAFWLLVTAIHLYGWQAYWHQGSPEQIPLLSYVSSLTALALGWRALRRATIALSWAQTLGMQAFQTAGLIACLNMLPLAPPNQMVGEVPPGELVQAQLARTDRGTPIKLFVRQVEAQKLVDFYASNANRIQNLAKFAMFRDEPTPAYNCHGWVFSGSYIIKGEDVPTILKDNGYVPVEKPELNDLIIYSDLQGTVLHTGIIAGFLHDQPLIESKWGISGIYVHPVEHQPYSPHFAFYRSARQGHKLKACESPSETATAMLDRTANAATIDLTGMAAQNLR